MSPREQAIDCPNPNCAAPAALALCTRFSHGFGLQLDADGPKAVRWDDVHCLVCGHFSSPYVQAREPGRDLSSDPAWLIAVDRALLQAKRGRLHSYLQEHDLSLTDLLAMRQAVQGLRHLLDLAAAAPPFPQVGMLRIAASTPLPEMFGVAHGEAESEPFVRKVRLLGRLLGAVAAETSPRHCTSSQPLPTWFFYSDAAFIGLLALSPNRSYRGTMTIDGCLERLLHAG
jgi:hypothetical protein